MIYFRPFILVISLTAFLQATPTQKPPQKTKFTNAPRLAAKAVRMPLWFEPNQGQFRSTAAFVARAQNQAVHLEATRSVIQIFDGTGSESVQMRFVRAANTSRAEGIDLLPGVSNYFSGTDPTKWRTNVPHYAKVRFRSVYPGIDVVYYSTGTTLEYDFVLSPGADPNRIQLAYDGARKFSIDDSGNVHLQLAGREIVQRRPRIYQEIGGKRVEVAGSYRVKANGTVQFAVTKYDRSQSLVIDPVLDYSVYLGGAAYDTAISLTLDSAGNKYVTGSTASSTLVSNSQFQTQFQGATDAYLAKFDAAGNLRYFTYLGGAASPITGPKQAITTGRAVVLDRNGDVYIAGDTNAGDMPVAAIDPKNFYAGGSSDAFVSKIAAAGDRLIYTKYVGGGSDDFVGGGRGCGTPDAPDCLVPGRADEFGSGLAVDAQGFAYITGFTRSTDFPIVNGLMTKNKSTESIFVTKLNQAGTDFVYSTAIEGNGRDAGEGIALDTAGNIYITGFTTSTNFPTSSTAFQRTNRSTAGSEDAFVLKLDPTAQRLIYSTYLGGVGRDLGFRIAVDGTGNAYITGYTQSPDFPARNAAQPTFGGGADAFVTKVSPDGSNLIYSTFLGGSGNDWGFADIAVDANGNAYVAGYTTSTNLPVANAFQPQFGAGDTHGYVGQLNASGTAWAFLSYYGGSQHDEIHSLAYDGVRNSISIAGFTSSPDLPGRKNAFVGDQAQGRYDAFVAQIVSLGQVAPTLTATPPSLTFNIAAGSLPATQSVSLASTGIPLQFTIASGLPAWLSVSTSATTTPATLTVAVDPRALTSTVTTGAINVDVIGGSRTTIPVQVNLSAGPIISSVSPNTIAAGADNTTITVTGSGYTPTSTIALNGAATTTQFVSSSTLTAVVPRNLLTNAGAITVTVFNGASSSAPTTITVVSGLPVINSSNILNGATNLPGPISPGEIITIKGTGFGPGTLNQAQLDPATGGIATTVAATRVLINGQAAPLVYSTTNQVAAIVPYSVTTGPASIAVEYQGQRSAAVNVDVALAAPGIFTADSTGRGQAVVFNEDGTVNSSSNPAKRGSIVTFFGTGEGLTNPAGVTGSLAPTPAPKPAQDVKVKINGLDGDVIYAGGVPGLVEGLLQVNARVPGSAPSGSAIPLVLQIGGFSSPVTVTLAIE